MRNAARVFLSSAALSCVAAPAVAALQDHVGTVRPGDANPDRDVDAEILVTANRRYGEAEVASEAEFAEEDIAAEAVDSIDELLDRLAPFIDDSEDEPVILINGEPAGFDRSILSYPPEALNRLAVLKPEAAARYGHPPGKRVVNLVLKKSFASLTADASVDFATAGGQYGGDLSAGRVAIEGATRWNVQARIGYDSALRKDARDIRPDPGDFDATGFVAALDGGEIDPALSELADETVTAAALGFGTGGEPPILADFAAGANALDPVDPNRFKTLQSSRRNMSLNLGVTRPLGDFSASLNLNASRTESSGLRGLPMVSAVLPAASPWSPFASDVLLIRPFAGERALRSDNGSNSLSGSLTVNGDIAGWQTSIAATYSRSRSNNLLELGPDIERIRELVETGDPGFDPYGAWPDDLLLASRNRSSSDNIRGRLMARNDIAELPAGAVTANVSLNAGSSRSLRRGDNGLGTGAGVQRTSRRQLDGRVAFSIPLAARGDERASVLGDLTAGVSLSGEIASQGRLQKRFDGDLNWSPLAFLELRGSFEHAESAPSFEQLDAPLVTTINRVFDYAQQEIAEPIWITGGNPGLMRGSRETIGLDARINPFDDRSLTLSVGYRQRTARGAVATFPELTPAIEAAFPDRVERDAQGRLISVDARAINLARETDSALTSRVALRLPRRGSARGRVPPADRIANPLQVTLSLSHRWQLKDELLTGPGLPVIDQLAGGGRSRHSLSLQGTLAKRGMGANLRGSWSSPSRVQPGAGGGAQGAFRYDPAKVVDLSLFIEPEHWAAQSAAWLENARFSLEIGNVFNDYRRVTLADGTVPEGFSRDQIDPLGRTMQLSVRKRF